MKNLFISIIVFISFAANAQDFNINDTVTVQVNKHRTASYVVSKISNRRFAGHNVKTEYLGGYPIHKIIDVRKAQTSDEKFLAASLEELYALRTEIRMRKEHAQHKANANGGWKAAGLVTTGVAAFLYAPVTVPGIIMIAASPIRKWKRQVKECDRKLDKLNARINELKK
ncbi:hypothetical protein KMW28_27195 [Flammeovirga yaeyamensis]|uniref:Uncharacterized protein n=1 Tax=Flammeovirga yaeyamensis TaxID=367791 RepID=A0AAX1NAT3_9BACT|nr:hypothetical protein [Flammeovirga yaeyamensis]MBB3700033.1 hypothetical protein [Flammeovirga yaeyamensis]NMF37530.1 hypothetical protein [Flammeovirga yaeyamensis]QWG04587.1 hypothetical protein KMW28_27195 [Flammeovirga yaeyamensis]